MAIPSVIDGAYRQRRARAMANGRWDDHAHVAAGQSGDGMMNFNPPSRPADAEVLRDREKIAARSRAMTRNNGWAAGAVEKEVESVVGAQFRPTPKPDFRALGLDAAWAADFKRQVQSDWRAWAEDPLNMADLSRTQSVGQMLGGAYRSYVVDGDALAQIAWRPDRARGTCLRLIDPDLLSNPMDMPDEEYLRGGIELDQDGAAVAYHFRQAHRATLWPGTKAMEWMSLPREEVWGRPIILHHFDKKRDGQTRGVSRLAPIIEALQMEDQYGRTELQAAILNAALALFVRSPMDAETMAEALEDSSVADGIKKYDEYRTEFHGEDGVRFGGARVPHLFPGEEIEAVSAVRPASQFGEFEGAVLRKIASGLGISYEQLSSDWSKTNYSSARAALIEIWRGWTSKRESFAQGFCQPLYLAWLEEQITEGHIALPEGAPDFYDAWAFYTRADWIGPGKGFVDPVKEATAAGVRVSLGLSTMEREAAELTGSDHSENIEQIQMEIESMKGLGIMHPAQESYAKLLISGGQRQMEVAPHPDEEDTQ